MLASPAEALQDEQLEVVTHAFELTLSARGGVPVRWVARPTSAGAQGRALLDADVLSASAFRPLSVVTEPDPMGVVPVADQRLYEFERSGREGRIELTFTSPIDADGLRIVKTYAWAPDGQAFRLRVELRNAGTAPLHLGRDGLGPGLTLGPGLGISPGRQPERREEGRDTSLRPLFATAEGVTSRAVDEEEARGLEWPPPGDELLWGGIHTQFHAIVLAHAPVLGGAAFARARVAVESGSPVSRLVGAGELRHYPCVTFFEHELDLASGASRVFDYVVYAGPKQRDLLEAVDPAFGAILFHHLWDWLAALVRLLEVVLAVLNRFVGGWGLAIVVFAVLFRLVTLPLTLFGARQQILIKAKTEAVKPLMAEIKRQHAKDGRARDEAILLLYKEHGINPMSHFKGCLPLLIQLPVMIALFNLLMNSYELRGVPFLWIDDLTLADRLLPLGVTLPWLGSYVNLLPLLMLGAQVLIARSASVSSAGGGASLWVMPVLMTLLFYPFPAGAMLFWTTGNILQVGEQRFVAARVAARPA